MANAKAWTTGWARRGNGVFLIMGARRGADRSHPRTPPLADTTTVDAGPGRAAVMAAGLWAPRGLPRDPQKT